MFRTVELIGICLIKRYRYRLGGRLCLIPSVYRYGRKFIFSVHITSSSLSRSQITLLFIIMQTPRETKWSGITIEKHRHVVPSKPHFVRRVDANASALLFIIINIPVQNMNYLLINTADVEAHSEWKENFDLSFQLWYNNLEIYEIKDFLVFSRTLKHCSLRCASSLCYNKE